MASAARAVAKLKTDWSKLASLVPKQEQAKLNKLKAFCDGNIQKMAALPDKLPAIDWSYYRANASDPKLVDELEKSFKSVKVEYPVAPESRFQELKAIQDDHTQKLKAATEKSRVLIAKAHEIKEKFEKMIPVKDMNLEDFTLTFPDWSLHHTRPSIAPHYEKSPGLTREQAAEFAKPDPVPYSTPSALKDWEETKKLHYS